MPRCAISSASPLTTTMPQPRCSRWQNRCRGAGGTIHAERRTIRIFRAKPWRFVCATAGLTPGQLDAVVFYDKPILKFARLLETYLAVAPGGWRTFPVVLSNWLGEKLNLRKTIREELPELRPDCRILFTEHHRLTPPARFIRRHLTRRRFSPWTALANGPRPQSARDADNEIQMLKELRFPHSLGLLYSAFTDLLRLPHQFRRVQAHGSGAVWRAEIRRRHLSRIARSEAGRFVSGSTSNTSISCAAPR